MPPVSFLRALWVLKSQMRFLEVEVGTSSPTIRASRSSPWESGRVKAASMACYGSEWERPSEHGEAEVALMTTEAMSVPEVGDDSFGQYEFFPEGDFRWDLRSVLVRDGGVLMLIVEFEVNGIDDNLVMSQEELDSIVTTAYEKLAA